MLHATLKSIHLLAMFVWLGGMFFALVCLRPALGVLEPPPLRLRLMNAVLRRFFVAVSWAAGLMLASGALMMAGLSGGGEPTPAVAAMAALGIVMIGVFVFVRVLPFKRLQAALAAVERALNPPPVDAEAGARWRWHCERCGDANCERHALLPRQR